MPVEFECIIKKCMSSSFNPWNDDGRTEEKRIAVEEYRDCIVKTWSNQSVNGINPSYKIYNKVVFMIFQIYTQPANSIYASQGLSWILIYSTHSIIPSRFLLFLPLQSSSFSSDLFAQILKRTDAKKTYSAGLNNM